MANALTFLAECAAAAVLVLGVNYRGWAPRRLPLLLLCAVMAAVCWFRPPQITYIFIAMIGQSHYVGISGGFLLLTLLPIAIAVIRLGPPELSDMVPALAPAIALTSLAAVSSPLIAATAAAAIFTG